MNITITMDDSGNPIFSQEGNVDMDSLLKELFADNKELKSIVSDKLEKVLNTIKLDNKALSESVVKGFENLFDFSSSYKKQIQGTINSKVEDLLDGIKLDGKTIGKNISSLFEYKDKDKQLKSVFDKINTAVSENLMSEGSSDTKTNIRGGKGISISHIDPNVLKAVIMDANVLDIDSGVLTLLSSSLGKVFHDENTSFLEPHLIKIEDILNGYSPENADKKKEDTVFENEATPVSIVDVMPEAMEKLKKIKPSVDTIKTPEEQNQEEPKSKLWTALGGLLGAGLILWLNKDKIKKWWDEDGHQIWDNIKTAIKKWWNEDGKPMWENIKNMVTAYIIEPIQEYFDTKIKNTELYKTLKRWQEKPLMLQILDASGMTSDSRGTGIMKMIDMWLLRKASGFWNIITKPFKALAGFFDNFLTKKLGQEGLEGLATKAAPKFFGREISDKLGKKIAEFFAKRAKLIPGIGAVIGLGFGINRIINGDISGGFIDVASGIASVFPGIGTAISVALDVLNVGRDIKYGGPSGAAKTGFNQWWKNEFPKILTKIPLISGLMNLAQAITYFVEGDWKTGLYKLIMIIPGLDMLSGFIDADMEAQAGKNGQSLGEYVWKGISQWFSDLFDAVMEMLTGATEKLKAMAKEKIVGAWSSAKQKTAETWGDIKEKASNIDLNPFNNETKVKTNDLAISYTSPKRIQLQLDSRDTMERIGDTDVYSKSGGTLDKAIGELKELLLKQLAQLENAASTVERFLSEVASNTLAINQNLPLLAKAGNSEAPVPAELTIPNGYIRDPIYEYRMKIRAMGI